MVEVWRRYRVGVVIVVGSVWDGVEAEAEAEIGLMSTVMKSVVHEWAMNE